MPTGRAKGIRAGRAYVEVTADDRLLARGLRRAELRMKSFGAGLTKIGGLGLAAGAALAAPFIAATAIFAKTGDQLDKMSLRTGVAVESLSALGFAAERNGSSLEVVEKGLKKLAVAVRSGTLGLTAYTDAFDELGISSDRLAQLSPEDQFLAVADALSKVEDQSRRSALAQQLLGKAGSALLPLFAQGAGGIEELRKQAQELGLIFDSETTTSAAMLTDAMGDLRAQAKAVAVAIGAAVAPALTRTIRVLNPIVAKAIELVKANKPLVAGVAAVAVALLAAGAAAVIAGGAITLAGIAAGGLATAIGLALSPITVVIVAVAALAVAVAKYTTVVGRAGTALRSVFGPLAGRVIEVFAAIRNAILAGDLEAALEVVTTGLRLIWLRTMNFFQDRWNKTATGLLRGFADFWAGSRSIFAAGATALQVGVQTVLTILEKVAAVLNNPVRVGKGYFQNLLKEFDEIEARGNAANLSIITSGIGDQGEIQTALDNALAMIRASQGDSEESSLVREIRAAEEALQAAIERAKAARADAELERESFQFDLDDLGEGLKARIDTFGQFGGANLDQAFAAGRLELEEAKKTARNTDRIAKGIDRLESRLAFT